MRSRLFRLLVMLYPRRWRERYSEEIGDLSAELLVAGEVTRLRLVLELLGSAFAERVRSLHRSRFVLVLSGSAALVVVVVVAFLATNGFGLGGSTSPRVTPVGWYSVSYRGAQVSVPPSVVAIGTGPGGITRVIFQTTSPPSVEPVWDLLAEQSCACSPCARFPRPTPVRSPPRSTACRSTSARRATTTRRP
jgi:hypothetical protein